MKADEIQKSSLLNLTNKWLIWNSLSVKNTLLQLQLSLIGGEKASGNSEAFCILRSFSSPRYLEERKACRNAGLFAFLSCELLYLYSYSQDFDKYYIGHSEDPWRRIEGHNFGKFHKFTSYYRPWRLVAIFKIDGIRGDAMRIEKFIKKQKSRTLIRKLIDPDYIPGASLAQLVRVPHVRD